MGGGHFTVILKHVVYIGSKFYKHRKHNDSDGMFHHLCYVSILIRVTVLKEANS